MKDKLRQEPEKPKRIVRPFCGESWNGGFKPLRRGDPGMDCFNGWVFFWMMVNGQWERYVRRCECQRPQGYATQPPQGQQGGFYGTD